MNLYIAGGCGEHGCNSFLVKGKERCILMDCGLGFEGTVSFPLLSREQAERIDCVFLTHRHMDHIAALPWLLQLGFSGKIYLSPETRPAVEQLLYGQTSPANTSVKLIPLPYGETVPLEEGIQVRIGSSGHCSGSCWYLLKLEGKTIFFSGDYCTHSFCFPLEEPRGVRADLAVIDCAYGDHVESAAVLFKNITDQLGKALEEGKPVLLPAPEKGRGVDLLRLAEEAFPGVPIYLDQKTKKEAAAFSLLSNGIRALDSFEKPAGQSLLFLSDPQLKEAEGRNLAGAIQEAGGSIFFTGHVYQGSYGRQLLQERAAKALRYPVHQNAKEMKAMMEKNRFRIVVPFHCPEAISSVSGVRNLKRGEHIEF